jgi:hypothetical protein
MARKPATEIFSIFGQVEEAAAETMIAQGKITKIPYDRIPQMETRNSLGQDAKFAVVVPSAHREEFENLIASLRA